jgi:hypothetical protein
MEPTLTTHANTVFELFEIIQGKAPEYIKLLTAKTEEEFDDALDAFVERASMHLEANSKNFSPLDEVGLSGVFAASIEMPGLKVVQEGHSNGHVDLTISADHCHPARKKLCEAKIYGGPSYHISGLSQLLTRYTTGREGRGIVLSYVKQKNISGLVTGLKEKMNKELPCEQQGPTVDHKMKWSFLSSHAHSCGDTLQVCHVSCNLHSGDEVKP